MTQQLYVCRETCRLDGSPLQDVLPLGEVYLSGFTPPDAPDPLRHPLTLAVGRNSGLVQLRESVAPDLMFRRYFYRSGLNETMAAHLAGIAQEAARRVKLTERDIVVDIGCNDGTLLSSYPVRSWRVGYDPSDIVPSSGALDVHINDYFTASTYPFSRRAKVVTSIAMLYDVEDPVWFAAQVAAILHPDGLWITEQHSLLAMLETNDYSVICAEHLTYLSLTVLSEICRRAGLKVLDVETNGVNGGSFRAYIGFWGAPTPRVEQMLEAEKALDLDGFAARVFKNREQTLELLHEIKQRGERVFGLAASTKFNTVLNFCGITPDMLHCIADRNPEKHGLVTAGTRIPIVSEEEARALKPDYWLVGAWHFLKQLMARENQAMRRKNKYIVLFPEPHIVQ